MKTADLLWVRVTFGTGDEKEFAIVGRMPVVEFRERIDQRYPGAEVRKLEFLHEPTATPVIAEVL